MDFEIPPLQPAHKYWPMIISAPAPPPEASRINSIFNLRFAYSPTYFTNLGEFTLHVIPGQNYCCSRRLQIL